MVGLVQLADVVGAGSQPIGIVAAAIAQPSDEQVGGSLQVDDQIRCGDVLSQQVEEALVDEQLVVIEVQIRKDLVLVEQVIADCGLREQIGLLQRELLPVTTEQVEQLRL